MKDHYLSKRHQDTISKVLRHRKSELLSTQTNIDLPPQTTTTVTSDPITIHLQEMYDTLDILCGSIETLNDDGQHVNNESLQNQIKLQTSIQEFSQLKLSVEEIGNYLDGLKLNQDIVHQDLASLKEQINDMQYVSYDGILIWKITKFREKMSKYRKEKGTTFQK
jgi:hypothetical protein